jgi:hypothetical protein
VAAGAIFSHFGSRELLAAGNHRVKVSGTIKETRLAIPNNVADLS